MKIYNCHTHSGFSHDATGSVEEMALFAIKHGLSGIVISDHCDCEYNDDSVMKNNLLNSFEEANRCKEIFQGKIDIFAGIEIGDALYSPEFADEMIASKKWDVVLGSVHAVRIQGKEIPFSLIDFSQFTDEEIRIYVWKYFSDLKEMALTTDYDILSHLTVILRYVKYKYNRNVSAAEHINIIKEILEIVIERDKSLEINISGFKDGYFMPDMEILSEYKKLGGKKITIGNDSHSPQNIGDGFNECLSKLQSAGYNRLVYYKNRKPIEYYL